ncbi:VanZ family protein [Candidatus Gottesmanbacteria bacterium]|nr:VanZ family protein [Candidatus Gottesmanbacteria bacterium]
MIVIFVFSSHKRVQVSDEETINFIFFKTLHVLEYAILFLLNVRAFRKKNFLAAAILTIAYALTDEIHQLYVPTRQGQLRDVIIDGIGVILAWTYLTRLLPKAPKKLRTWGRDWLKN